MVGRGGVVADDFCFMAALLQLRVAASISVKYIWVDFPTQNIHTIQYIFTVSV